ncbi:hypothetical protein CTA1_9473 [Colletotrichum tanaceti]|uniref:Uncharacterized protein n=1 Tax=Colletotrichum tanaceti TaxID=1306861 RepID=A0A4U6X7F3_9PEZI|nr:hypothetical protein CTA1_9473 [Colletotrichum tanaceti]
MLDAFSKTRLTRIKCKAKRSYFPQTRAKLLLSIRINLESDRQREREREQSIPARKPSGREAHLASRLGALPDGIDDAQHVPRLARRHGNVLLAARLDRLGERLEELEVRLGLDRQLGALLDLAAFPDEEQPAAVDGVVDAEAGLVGLPAGLEVVLLRVERRLVERGLGAAHPEARLLRLDAHDADAHGDEQAVPVGQLRVHAVRVLGVEAAVALADELAVDRLGHAEEVVGLVEQVGAQVVEGAAALVHAQLALPRRRGLRAVAVKVGVELVDAAKDAVSHHLLDRQEVAVPAAVLVDADEAPVLLGDPDELLGLGDGGHEGLLDQHVLAGLERLLGEAEVGVGRREDVDDVDLGVLEHGLQRGVVLQRRVVVGRRRRGRGLALDDAVQLELGGEVDEGDVEDLGGQSVLGDISTEN